MNDMRVMAFIAAFIIDIPIVMVALYRHEWSWWLIAPFVVAGVLSVLITLIARDWE